MNSTTPIDLTRLNRKDRRKLLRSNNLKIPGRNLPYYKIFGTISGFYEKRDKEIAAEMKANETKKP